MERLPDDQLTSEHVVLRRRSALTVWQSLGLRALLVILLASIALLGHWLDRGGLKDNFDNEVSFTDVVYFTTITITTVGYGDIVPVTDRARLFDSLVVTPIRVFVWIIFLGTAYTFVLRSTWERIRTAMIGNRLKGHTIVCGFGAGGEFAARELLCSGTNADDIVVIDKSAERIAVATDLGLSGIVGDATHNAVLEGARIKAARAVLVATGRDDASALVVLSARQLNHNVVISTAARAQENEDLLHQAGASVVLNPVRIGGHLLARATEHHHAVDFVTDISSADGRVVVRERAVTAEEVGQPMRAISTGVAVRLIRDGKVICSRDSEAAAIAKGDTLVEIVETAHV